MAVLWRIFLVLVAAVLIWRSLWSGASQHYADAAGEGDDMAVDRALAWNPQQPQALYLKAQSIRGDDPALASALLKRSFSANPSSAWPLLSLAGVAGGAGEESQAAALVEKATALTPANPAVYVAAGAYWAQLGDLDAAMKHWSRAMEASWTESRELIPILLELVEEPRSIGVFKQFAAHPPSWWNAFFRTAAQRASDIDAVRTLYAFRRAAEKEPITRAERDVYIRRLQKEGEITEAYLVWLNGLDADKQSRVGIIYNGGFEADPSNSGFDWHVVPTRNVTADTGTTAGVKGKNALHLIFKRREERYQHVYQPLFLGPGSYRAQGMVRTDSLKSKGGLKWLVRCLFPERADLGESPRFLGSSEWTAFSFEVHVPESCTGQEIRLMSAGRRDFELAMTGGIWFDALSMRREQAAGGEAPRPVPDAAAAIPLREAKPPVVDEAFDPLAVSGGSAFQFEPPLTGSLDERADGKAKAE